MANRDQYDKDILKTLRRIASSLERIEKLMVIDDVKVFEPVEKEDEKE